jgi:hypothetical protein
MPGMAPRTRIIFRVAVTVACLGGIWFGGRESLNITDFVLLAVIAAMSFWEWRDRSSRAEQK